MEKLKNAQKKYNDWFYNTLPGQLKKAAPYIAGSVMMGAAAYCGAEHGVKNIKIEMHLLDTNGELMRLKANN